MARLHLRISGVVQGVGFRVATRRAALQNRLTGWVRNLPDGFVEAEFEGDDSALLDIQNWCSHGPRFADVKEVLLLPLTDHGPYVGFEIR
jgi:acylphosphatase